jgi:hypothetical protein
MSPSPDAGGGHFPSLILTLGEPHPNGLADRMRAGVRERFGRDAAVVTADLGDLRLNDVHRGTAASPDPRAMERWLAHVLRDALRRHSGEHPARPQLTVLLVADADDPLARSRLIGSVEPVNRVMESLAAPGGLSPRIAALVGWPHRDPLPMEGASRAAWLRDIEFLSTHEEALEAILIVGRSNYRPDRAYTRLALLTREERDATMVDQACLLVSSGLLEESLSLGRGRRTMAWMAVGTAPLHDTDPATGWPWVSASDGAWGGWFPSPTHWVLGAPPAVARRGHGEFRPLAGSTTEPLRVACLAGLPTRFLAGYAEWEAIYRLLDLEERRGLHRVAEACPEVVEPEAPGAAKPEPVEWEMVP